MSVSIFQAAEIISFEVNRACSWIEDEWGNLDGSMSAGEASSVHNWLLGLLDMPEHVAIAEARSFDSWDLVSGISRIDLH